MTVGEALLKWQEFHELKVTGACHGLGCTAPTWAAWSRGERFPTIDALIRAEVKFPGILDLVIPAIREEARRAAAAA